MKHSRISSAELARILVAPSLVTFGIGTSTALVLPGCLSCDPPYETQYLIPQAEYDALLGGQEIPLETCERLCVEGHELGGGGGGGGAATPEPNLSVDFCELGSVDGEDHWLNCFQNDPCDSGRRPARLLAPRLRPRGTAAAFFATAAHLEAASVVAFVDLARELSAHRAPRSLVAAALRSAADEARHARLMRALAARHGARPQALRLKAFEVRPVEEIALHNAQEGCAGEALAAALLAEQARRAASPLVRAVFASVARDESRHAMLSAELAVRLEPALSIPARRRARDARAEALALRARAYEAEPSESETSELGMPSAEHVQAIVRVVERATLAATS